jgi:leucyl-tRNA synthetase
VKSRSDIERQQEKKITGCFTGSYAVHPFTQLQIPIWTAEYVLAGYGTGAIMAVPADDERDRKFAEKFGLPIIEVIDKSMHAGATIEDKVGKMINSDFLNGMEVLDAIQLMLSKVEELGIGTRKVNYKFRDSSFSRQRYWGEPIPMKYKVVGEPDAPISGESDDIPYPLSESELPLVLPEVDSFKPSGDGRSPLANSKEWVAKNLETDTMPGYAGSSWYFLRYMDAKNDQEFAAKEKIDYWQNVDIYFGGAEHAVGHLLYARFWNKFLYDLGYVPKDEPFQKLVNQGMIQGVSKFMYRLKFSAADQRDFAHFENLPPLYISYDIQKLYFDNFQAWYDKVTSFVHANFKTRIDQGGLYSGTGFGATQLHVDIRFVEDNGKLNIEAFKNWRPENADAVFITEGSDFLCESAVEKMSKSKYNVVNPDDVIAKYGADCLRMFEMFLGPLEQSKPWDDKGISGVSNFLRRFWRMFYDEGKQKWNTETATPAELKILHKTLKKVTEDIERLSFNTAVSAFMICVNELNDLKCTKREILEPLVIALAPFAPFMTEELWNLLGNASSVHQQQFPAIEEKYLVESEFLYPVSINGKVRANISFALDLSEQNIKQAVLENETISKWTEGKEPKKFIFVKGKIINVVI